MQPKQILIVDDDPNIRKTLGDILTLKGYVPESVDTGEAAIASVTRAKPAIVLLDLRLKDMSGLKAMERIKAVSPMTECIVLTGYASQNSAIEAVNLGAYSYLQKPYDPEQLLLVIRRATEKQQAEQEVIAYRSHLETLVEQRTRELMLAKKMAEAEQARAESASQAKSRFLANMSHELRTPLNAILGYAHMLKQADNLTGKQVENLETIQRSGEHLLTLIIDILDISKIEAGKLELEVRDFSLPGMLKNLMEMTRIRAEQKSLAFTTVLDENLPHSVSGDEKRLRQILLNLLGNAIKFTQQGGITFSVTRVSDENAIEEPQAAGDRRRQALIIFEIEDTGEGIPAEKLQKIFEPFQQVGDSRFFPEGTGLGLAISRQLVQHMGGELMVRSQVGQGTLFSFEFALPLAKTQKFQAAPAVSRTVCGYRGHRRKILLVDDIPENLALFSTMLGSLGFEIFTASDGREALRIAYKHMPDAILMDAVMPTMDGFEATRRMRRHPDLQHATVLMISAHAFEQDRQQSLAAGCDDFLTKPVSQDQLLDKLGRYLSLEWEYEKMDLSARCQAETAGSTIYPEREDLLLLLEAAQRGAPRGILKQLDELEEKNPDYKTFAAKIRNMNQAFDIEGICSWLEKILQGV